MCLEWPSQCQYWRAPQVKAFLQKHDFIKAKLHGCAYGLKNSKGNFMKKPWTVATTSRHVANGIHRTCDGTHEHKEARGR